MDIAFLEHFTNNKLPLKIWQQSVVEILQHCSSQTFLPVASIVQLDYGLDEAANFFSFNNGC